MPMPSMLHRASVDILVRELLMSLMIKNLAGCD